MGVEQLQDWRATAATTLDWWIEAGVDTLVDELPRDWLAPLVAAPKPDPTPMAVAAVAADALAQAALPATLEAFLPWRLGDATPEARWSRVRLGPVGDAAAAELLVLTDMPEEGDAVRGNLLSGVEGRLLDRMLAAIGASRDGVLLASVCTARPLAGRVPAGSVAELETLARHLIELVRPRRMLLLGQAATRALLRSDGPEVRGCLQHVNHGDIGCGVVATYHPRVLLERPACKADAWRDLQLLIEGPDA